MKNVNPLVWQHGGLAGALIVVMLLVGYLSGPQFMVSTTMSLVQGGVLLFAMIFSGVQIRKDLGGYWSFGRAFLHAMLTTAVVLAVSGIFSIILYNFIAGPDFIDSMVRSVQDKTIESMSAFGAPQSMIDEVQETLEVELRKGFSVGGLLQGLLWNLLFWAIPALIVAAVLKRKPENEFIK